MRSSNVKWSRTNTCCVCINCCNQPPKYRGSNRERAAGERCVCRPFQPGFPQGDSKICEPQSQRKADHKPIPSPNTKAPVNLRVDVISSTYTNYSRGLTITPSPIMVWKLTVENWMFDLRTLSADSKAQNCTTFTLFTHGTGPMWRDNCWIWRSTPNEMFNVPLTNRASVTATRPQCMSEYPFHPNLDLVRT